MAFNRPSCFEQARFQEMRYLLKKTGSCVDVLIVTECCCLGKEEAQLLLGFRSSSLHEHVCRHSTSSLNQSSVAPGSLYCVCVTGVASALLWMAHHAVTGTLH